MKYFRLLFLSVVIVAVAIACGNNAHNHNHSDETSTEMHEDHQGDANATQDSDNNGPEYTSAYVCPMHCKGSGSDQPGKCPVCNMDYVANPNHTKDGHEH